jgi:phage terminase large subunit
MHQVIDLGYTARPQFVGFHKRKERFACIVAHRRAGKTVACIRDLVDGALRCDKIRPRFAYIAPYRSQAKTLVWDYLREATFPLISAGATLNESELRADYPNGGQVRLHGADNPDALRGIYLDGVVLDEFADMDPRVWPLVISPALSDRRGWAVFIGTPKGHNDFYKQWQQSQSDPGWFSLMLKASDTLEHLTQENPGWPQELEEQKRTKSEEQYAQEYECSFEAAIQGAYYGKLLTQAHEEKRICGVPYDAAVRVWTWWDLGIGDSTAIWFAQLVGREVHLIDYYEASGAGLGHYVKELNARPYIYAGHVLPHDAKAHLQDEVGRTRIEILESLGLKNLEVLPQHERMDGIEAGRVLMSRCWFDATKCARGIEALKQYRTEYDDKLKVFRNRPLHDWTSHAADAFRYGAKAIEKMTPRVKQAIKYPSSWAPV